MWNRTGSQDLKMQRDKAIVAKYQELLTTHKHNATRISTIEQQFYISKQRIIQILKSHNVYHYEQTRGLRPNQ